jgi:hypothetical protein
VNVREDPGQPVIIMNLIVQDASWEIAKIPVLHRATANALIASILRLESKDVYVLPSLLSMLEALEAVPGLYAFIKSRAHALTACGCRDVTTTP